jgi:hypothetical protein
MARFDPRRIHDRFKYCAFTQDPVPCRVSHKQEDGEKSPQNVQSALPARRWASSAYAAVVSTDGTPHTGSPGVRPHPALAIAALLVTGEGAVAAVFGRAVLVAGDDLTAVQNLLVTGFFFACAAALAVCALGLWVGRRWARAPVVFAQLLQLGVAWSFFSGSTLGVALALLVVAVVVLGLVLAPSSTVAFNRDQETGGVP